MPLASCRCAAHTFEVAPPPRVTICFCSACQSRSGGPFGIGAYYDAAELDLPELPSRRRIADSGRWLDDHHCPDCGVVLYHLFEMRPGVVGVPLGRIEGAVGLVPDKAVFCAKKPDWITLPDTTAAYVGMSSGPRWTGEGAS